MYVHYSAAQGYPVEEIQDADHLVGYESSESMTSSVLPSGDSKVYSQNSEVHF